MDLKVCSRQVHDGYATIRSRGRSRPRPITDSEEGGTVADGGGDRCALGPRIDRISATNFTDDEVRRTSRERSDPRRKDDWSCVGKNDGKTILETYGTLRIASKRNDARRTGETALKTFRKVSQERETLAARNDGARKEPRNVRRSRSCVIVDEKRCNVKNNNEGFVVDKAEKRGIDGDRAEEERTLRTFSPVDDRSARRVIVARPNALPRSKIVQSGTKRSVVVGTVDRKPESRPPRGDFGRMGSLDKDTEGSEPIYALPNSASTSRSRRDRRAVVVDGNYVQSGDLYRTTVKYIEDVNKNIAGIDKSYKISDESSRSSYGVINEIAKSETLCLSDDLCGYLRNRGGMVPMPPISPNFGENLAENFVEKHESNNEPSLHERRIEIAKSIRRSSSSSATAAGTRRKVPPSPSVRSSSLSSTSRHSTGSTTTSSTKSTDSLHAIDESANEKAHLLGERNPSESASDGIESNDDDRFFEISRCPPCQNTLPPLDAAGNPEKRKNPLNPLDRNGTGLSNFHARDDVLPANFDENKYGTLPYRRSKERTNGRSLHKSTEDVLDRTFREKVEPSFRGCSSSIDVSDGSSLTRDSLYQIDATDVILRGQLERSRLNLSAGDTFSTTIFAVNARTRHDSLKLDPRNEDESGKYRHALFATLPRRGSVSRDQVSNDSPRRLSGNVTLLEPLYEHAVSDPVKPRSTDNVIPWWELATRKYRHRSCPSLQVNEKMTHLQSVASMSFRGSGFRRRRILRRKTRKI